MAVPRLRERFRFEARERDANGVRSGPFVLVTEEPAELTGLAGGEEVMASRLEGRQPVLIVVRYHRLTAVIDSSHRAVDARSVDQGGTGATFDIKSATPRPRHDFVDILAVRLLAGTPG